MEIYPCRVCGLDAEHPQYDPPTFDYCFCCGAQFGYHDVKLKSVRKNRDHWLKNGAQWSEPEEKPEDWNLEEQLTNIPKEWW